MERTRESVLNMIKNLPFFDNFDAKEVREIASYMSLQQIKQGEVLFREGDVGDYLFFIVEGVVEIVIEDSSQRNKVIASITAGASVGEMSLLDDYERSASVRAATDLEIMVLTRTRFEKILHDNPITGVKVLQGLARNISMRLRSQQGRYRDLV